MKYYKSYLERQEISQKPINDSWPWGKIVCQQAGAVTSRTRWGHRWGALAACCALALGLGVWHLAQPAPPGGQTAARRHLSRDQRHLRPGEEPRLGSLWQRGLTEKK